MEYFYSRLWKLSNTFLFVQRS